MSVYKEQEDIKGHGGGSGERRAGSDGPLSVHASCVASAVRHFADSLSRLQPQLALAGSRPQLYFLGETLSLLGLLQNLNIRMNEVSGYK